MYLYKKSMYDKFKFKFPGLENIETSYSQLLQDMFVLAVTEGKKNGTYVEIGADHPTFINNTWLLEKEFGWNGISVDISVASQNAFRYSDRTSKFILGDATTLDYRKIFKETFDTSELDYLQVDCEPNTTTLLALEQIPFDEYKFGVVTLEHDHYDRNMTPESNDFVRKEMRKIMLSKGYVMVAGNISNLDYSHEMEDWWVSDKFSLNHILKFMRYDDDTIPADKYMFGEL